MNANEICSKAAELVGGERQRTHGDKLPNHVNIARLWNGYLAIRRDQTAALSALDVAHMMVLLKIARTQLGDMNPDNWVDMVGYSAVAGEIAEATK